MAKVSSNSLPIGHILDTKYEILDVLGDGAFGVTYKVRDTSLNRLEAIKEFLPTSFSARDNDRFTVCVRSESDVSNYEWGLESFAKEAKTLANFEHKNIVGVRTTFKENNTAYFVMPFEEGRDLSKHLKKLNRKLTEDEVINIAIPILNGLKELHSQNLLHRDIKPENIFMRDKGMPMLIDFGAAREAIGSKSQDLTQILTPKYAPPEQYESDRSKQGPWTDIYSLGMVLYRLITGEDTTDIPASPDRQCSVYVEHCVDPLRKPKVGEYSQKLIDTIWKMLEIRAKDRQQNANEVIKMLTTSSSLQDTCNRCGESASSLKNGICKDCGTEDFGKECKKCHNRFQTSELKNGICLNCGKTPKKGWVISVILAICIVVVGVFYIYGDIPSGGDVPSGGDECTEDDQAVGLC